MPLNAPHRNYKDKNHKLEVMVALSDFWLLHGFQPKEALKATLASVPELAFLLPVFGNLDYKALYKKVMEMPQPQVNEVLHPLVSRVLGRKGQLPREDPDFWVNKLYSNGKIAADIDRGIFSIYFFNIVQVLPGQGIYQGAGVPHAYLEGQNMELMANSDNVLRCGLTPKHVDVPELLNHTRFEAVAPRILYGNAIGNHEKYYECPVDDFGLSLIELQPGEAYRHTNTSSEIYLIAEGAVTTGVGVPFHKGESLYVLPETNCQLKAGEKSVLYKAFVPLKQTN